VAGCRRPCGCSAEVTPETPTIEEGTIEEGTIDEGLARMQALASRTMAAVGASRARHHPGQLAWSARYAEPAAVTHGPVAFWPGGGADAAWAWLESPTWAEPCVAHDHPEAARDAVAWVVDQGATEVMTLETETAVLAALRGGGFTERDLPWFTHHVLDLAELAGPPAVDGYRFRHIEPGEPGEPGEIEARAAVHRAAWSPPPSTSKVTTAAYSRLVRTPPYRSELDWVAVDAADRMVACLTLWLDDATGVVLLEPVGTVPEHRGRGLAGALSLAALRAARDLGATTGLVCPRGDDDYPVPQRVYRGIGFRPVARTLTLQRGPEPRKSTVARSLQPDPRTVAP
jgi:predicted N-acetyltransferase YhbS